MENYRSSNPLITPKPAYKMHPLVRLIVISVGFMTDAYDLFVIGIVMVILRKIYGEDTQAESVLATAVLVSNRFFVFRARIDLSQVGATLGQLFFGLMGDKIGRRKMFIVTLLIITVMAIACALAFPNSSCVFMS